MKEYRELLEQAVIVEEKSQKPKSLSYIDVENTEGYAFITKPRSYVELLALATRISGRFELKVPSGKSAEPPRPQMQQRVQQAYPAVEAVTPVAPVTHVSADASAKEALEKKLKVSEPAPVEQPQVVIVPPVQQTTHTAELALREIGELAKVAGTEPHKEQAEIKFETTKRDLVLPSLSVNDQISDLEGIIESLKNNRFDKYQMEIVADELHGLERIVGSGKADAPSDQLQSDLVGLRNRRLSEALAILPKE